jgi:hypothetical protein
VPGATRAPRLAYRRRLSRGWHAIYV